MFLINGKKFNPYSAFEYDGIQYASNWFETSSPEDRSMLGIVETPDTPKPDERFFDVQEQPDGTYVSTVRDLVPVKERFKTDIDITCGNLRSQVVSAGDFVAEEYRVAYEESIEFKAAGYSGVVPQSIMTWSIVSGNSTQWAADDIIATRNQYVSVLNMIRDVRLKSKAAIDAAVTPDDILAVVNSASASFASLGAALA